jgi:hypothetical protein
MSPVINTLTSRVTSLYTIHSFAFVFNNLLDNFLHYDQFCVFFL